MYFHFIPIASIPAFNVRTTIERMLEAVTLNGANANLIDDITGSLEVGKMADIVIMDTNIYQVGKNFEDSQDINDLDALSSAQVIMTLFEGRIVYDAGGLFVQTNVRFQKSSRKR